MGGLAAATQAAATQLLRFADVWHDRIVFSYAGDLWTAGTRGGDATRLTAHPGLKLFPKFSPDGRLIAFTGQYGGDEQVYVMPAEGGAPTQLTYYPAHGPLADRWGYDNQVYGWTPDGREVLFRSARDGYRITDAKLYTVPAAGGAAMPLPMPVSGAGDFSADGNRLVYSPLWRDFRSEKRYEGGWANDLYIFDLRSSSTLWIARDPRAERDRRTDRDPMWIGAAIYFNSDRNGNFNLYRYDLSTRATRQVTHYKGRDVRWPSADENGQIVYELSGELHLYDARTDRDRLMSIRVPIDDTTRRPQPVDAADYIESSAISPVGSRAVIVARGDVFTVPLKNGVTRNLTHSSNADDREASWSADGRQLAYVSDRSGEEEIYVQPQDGRTPARAVTAGSKSRYYAPVWSADGTRLAFSDDAGRLFAVEIATRRRDLIASDPYDLQRDYRWSPDGQFLAYTLNDRNGFGSIHIWSVADGRSRRATPEYFRAASPAWAPAGDLLYFLSAHEYAPIISAEKDEFATDRQLGIFALALQKGAKNPFAVADDDPGALPAAQGPPAVKIDFDGLMRRVIRVPLAADDLSELRACGGTLLYLRRGPAYLGRASVLKPTVMAYSIRDREAKTIAEDAAAWSVTDDGRQVLVELPSKEFKLYDVAADEDEDARSVSLAGLETTRVPAQEWREIFADVWRRYRDYFYVENMHGFDWQRLREKYEPLVDAVGDREDLNYLMAEMIGELTVQHAYVEGGDFDRPKRPFVALAGARFELDPQSGRYRIAKIFAGQNEEERYRSPLTEVGVDVHVGDYVLAINGRNLAAGTNPYELLQAPANEPVEWRVSSDAGGKTAHTIRYQPLASETNLLYLAHVARNRELVDRLSEGRIGYIELPDMDEGGISEFIKWWYPQVRKEGMIVDVRGNGGGNISSMLIERLARKLGGITYVRHYAAPLTYPSAVQPGPKAALINEDTSSDGELFAHAFREWGLGPLIGKRTWGGVIGIVSHGPLLDGGSVYVPEFGNADAAGRWMIEGHGVDPDIVVEQDPLAVIRGGDPQLERGVAELMKRLPAAPSALPTRPSPPVKAGAP